MVDFNFLEELAIKIQNNRMMLKGINTSLSDVHTRLHEIPLQRTTESTFAKMIGGSYDDQSTELQNAKKELNTQRDKIERLVDSQINEFLDEITSENIVIPLESKPTFKDGNTIYKYREDKKYENVFVILSELLGISFPIVVKDVMLSPTETVIAEKDEFDAKMKFINIFNEIQNTLLIKKRI